MTGGARRLGRTEGLRQNRVIRRLVEVREAEVTTYSSVPKVLGQPGNGTQATVLDTSNFGGGVPGQIESPYRPPTFKRKPEIKRTLLARLVENKLENGG